jgi:hypothetical protein
MVGLGNAVGRKNRKCEIEQKGILKEKIWIAIGYTRFDNVVKWKYPPFLLFEV